jgi:Domain of unknown function DUF11/RTX calcium-binding nonapeptide repeat (4 copies)
MRAGEPATDTWFQVHDEMREETMHPLDVPRTHRRGAIAFVAIVASTLIASPSAQAGLTATADLDVTARLSAPWVRAGTRASLVVEVANAGPSTAPDVAVTSTLAAGLALLGADGTGDCRLIPSICHLGDIAPGEVEVVRFRIGTSHEGSFASDVVASSDATDPDLVDNIVTRILNVGDRSSRCTMRGTAGPDRLRGTRGRDVICALGGADLVRGLGGVDKVLGGKGKDRLFGGPRGDRIRGGKHADVLRGGAGRDRLAGGPGRDDMRGGRGNDRCRGHERGRSC